MPGNDVGWLSAWGGKNQTPAPQCHGTGADFKHAMREADDVQLMLSVAVEARRTLMGRTTTLVPTWTRL
jgi:hypothetical protein